MTTKNTKYTEGEKPNKNFVLSVPFVVKINHLWRKGLNITTKNTKYTEGEKPNKNFVLSVPFVV